MIFVYDITKKFYYVTQILLQKWWYDQSLLTLHFLKRSYHNFIFIRIWPEKPVFCGLVLVQGHWFGMPIVFGNKVLIVTHVLAQGVL